MSTKGYFSNLQNRYSANFIAITSCISLVYAIVFHTIDYLPRHLKWGYNLYGCDFPFAYWFISTSILGFIVLFVIFPYSNLILLCHEHHVETNDVNEFPVSKLKEMKGTHLLLQKPEK